jgi:poly-gamma-glutamate synthesis protein (capsule biosynthesis protein)
MRYQYLLAAVVAAAAIWGGAALTSRFFTIDLPRVFTYKAKIPAPRPPFTLVFGGDIMLDRQIRQFHADTGYQVFPPEILEILRNADAAIVNLEGPVTTLPSISIGSIPRSPENFSFTFAPESLASLVSAGIDAVSMGNNHIRDRGPEGIRQTKQFLDEAGLARFGSPDGSGATTTLTVASSSIGLIAYNQFFPPASDASFLADVSALASSTDFTVVFPHWGNEYELVPTEQQRELAQAFIDAGADAVIGAHPHVLQTFETYRDRAIAYSLGNFIFDQYFTEDVRNGALLSITINPETRTYTTHPNCTYIERDGTTSWKECPEAVTTAASMSGRY